MSNWKRTLRDELKPLLQLAGPVVLAELAWMGMNVVDLLMIGRVGPHATGAVSMGSAVHFTIAIFGFGLTLGMDALVSQAFGAGRLRDCRRTLIQGVYLALLISPPIMALSWWSLPLLDLAGVDPLVVELTRPYLWALVWSTPALLIYSACRRYIQGMGVVKPVLTVMLAANILNAILDWWLIFGGWGMPALGTLGAGWATCISRFFMAAMLIALIAVHGDERRLKDWPWRFDLDRMKTLWSLGWPAAVQTTLEVSAFCLSTIAVGRLGAIPLAAHQIVLNMASVTFMIPMGISCAAAVRVGHAMGSRRTDDARRAGWTALALGWVVMASCALVFLTMPRLLLSAYTNTAEVIEQGVPILFLAALFQMFDGVQVVSTGVMRGVGETRIPMYGNLVAHWLIALPIGWILAFRYGWGVYGIWIGFTIGLILVATILLCYWRRLSQRLDQMALTFDSDAPTHGH